MSQEQKARIALRYSLSDGYLARAVWTAQELLQTFGEQTEAFELVPGDPGDFEVHVDGKLVFSAKASGRFPEIMELWEGVMALLPE